MLPFGSPSSLQPDPPPRRGRRRQSRHTIHTAAVAAASNSSSTSTPVEDLYGYEPTGLAMSPDGVLFGADDNTKTLVQIDPAQGRAFAVNNVNQNFGFGLLPENYDFGMTFSCGGELHLVATHTQELYRVDPSTGVSTLVGNTGHPSNHALGNTGHTVGDGEQDCFR